LELSSIRHKRGEFQKDVVAATGLKYYPRYEMETVPSAAVLEILAEHFKVPLPPLLELAEESLAELERRRQDMRKMRKEIAAAERMKASANSEDQRDDLRNDLKTLRADLCRALGELRDYVTEVRCELNELKKELGAVEPPPRVLVEQIEIQYPNPPAPGSTGAAPPDRGEFFA
jgi:DNA repair exonuclease SbcCD ATPase subunit